MFVFLSKFLPPLIYPLGLIFFLLLLALIIRRTKPRLQTAILIIMLVILLVSSNRWVASSLVRSLEWQYLPADNLPQVEMIVVLGGGTESAQYPRPAVEVNGAGDRVIYAARLYHQGIAPRILVSGGNITWLSGRTMTPAEEMDDLLQLMGVPKEAILLQPKSQNTYEDAAFTAEMLHEQGIERVVLVTSAMHMPRSVGLFQKQGIEVIPAPADYSVTQATWDNLMRFQLETFLVNILPSAGAMDSTTNALKEYIGMMVYRLRGWM